MRSLIIKDLYNIGHNAKQMLILLTALAVFLVPSTGTAGFIITSTLLCSMMTTTTFSFDERSKWEKFALIMPVSRKEYIMSKYVINMIFSIIGIGIGIITALVIDSIKGQWDFTAGFGCVIVSLLIAVLYGSMIIPFMIKFGTENARMIIIGTTAVPALLLYGLYKLAVTMGVSFTDTLIIAILISVVLCLILLAVLSYKLSLHWFNSKEF